MPIALDTNLQHLPPLSALPEDGPQPQGPLASLVPQEPIFPEKPDAQPVEEEKPPTTAFATSLKLTPEREQWLVTYVFQRMEEVKGEMGLDANFKTVPGTWMSVREQNEKSNDGDYSWRMTITGSIFQKSNLSIGTNKRHTRYLAARLQDDLLGTSPCFAALGSNPDKQKLAKQAEEFMQQAVERSSVIDGIRNAQQTAVAINEAVVKVSYVKDASPFIGPAEVMVGPEGQPLKTPEKQLYIFRDDNFLPDPSVLPAADGTPGMVILEKDPSFTCAPADIQFVPFPSLPQSFTRYDGPVAEEIDFRNFLCPLKIDDIHKADFNAHLYHESPLSLKERYGNVDIGRRYFDRETGDQEPRQRMGEQEERISSVFERMHVAEVYLQADADEDGKAEQIFMVLDVQSQKVIYYEYLANHFDKRPFEVIPGIERVKNRWYGVGIYTLNEDDELAIDAWWNRANVRASRSSSMTFFNPSAVEEWNNGQQPVAGGDFAYRLNADYDPDKRPPIFKINLAEDAEGASEMMNEARQGADSKVGAISVKDASQADLNQSKTATGINSIEVATDIITKATEKLHIRPINAILEQVMNVLLKNMDRSRLMLNKDATELVTLNRDEIRALNRDVKLLLTKTRSSQVQQTSEAAINIGLKFEELIATNPRAAQRLRPLFIQQLKGMEVTEADEICPEVTDDQILQWELQQAAMAQQQMMAQAAKDSPNGPPKTQPAPRLAA